MALTFTKSLCLVLLRPAEASLMLWLYRRGYIFNPKRTKVFFVTLRTKGGGHFDSPPPPANSETKEARAMKLCTLIVFYKASITKQLKFINFTKNENSHS